MRIAIFAISFCEYVIQLANALAVRGHSVLLIFPLDLVQRTVGGSFQALLHSHVKAYLYDPSRRRRMGLYRDMLAALRRFDPEVIHFHENGELEVLPILLRFQHLPKVLTVHDVTPHPGSSGWSVRRKLIARLLASRADRIHVHSDGLKRSMARFRPHLSCNVDVIPHGSLNLFLHWALSDIVTEPSTCLFFGRMAYYRGLDNLMTIADLLKTMVPHCRIIVAGCGPELRRHRSQLERMGVFEIHEAFIPDSQVHVFFRRASLLLLPYHEASQSGLLAMSLSFGLPVVAMAVGAIPEVIVDGVHGKLVPAGDTKAFADAVASLLKLEALRSSMSRACLELAKEYNFTRLAPAYEQFYRNAIEGPLR